MCKYRQQIYCMLKLYHLRGGSPQALQLKGNTQSIINKIRQSVGYMPSFATRTCSERMNRSQQKGRQRFSEVHLRIHGVSRSQRIQEKMVYSMPVQSPVKNSQVIEYTKPSFLDKLAESPSFLKTPSKDAIKSRKSKLVKTTNSFAMYPSFSPDYAKRYTAGLQRKEPNPSDKPNQRTSTSPKKGKTFKLLKLIGTVCKLNDLPQNTSCAKNSSVISRTKTEDNPTRPTRPLTHH